MSLATNFAEKAMKSATKGKAAIKATPGNIKAKPGKIKAQGQAFKKAYKETPGESLGAHIKSHKVGFGITAVGTAADAVDIHDNMNRQRQTTHMGIDQRG